MSVVFRRGSSEGRAQMSEMACTVFLRPISSGRILPLLVPVSVYNTVRADVTTSSPTKPKDDGAEPLPLANYNYTAACAGARA